MRGKIPQRQEGHRLQPGPLGSSIQGWDGKDWGTEGVTWEGVMKGPAEELGLGEERGHHCGTLMPRPVWSRSEQLGHRSTHCWGQSTGLAWEGRRCQHPSSRNHLKKQQTGFGQGLNSASEGQETPVS